jgi:hypothetical protein
MVVLDPCEERVPLTFTRASVAYDYKGDSVPVNQPRFEHLINGEIQRGILIEESHTNLLTAEASQEILHAAPYTTGTLDGTYTFQCEGTGSYVLSGGATGTVSKDNPVTATIVSATVTLTPDVSSTLNQVLKTAYPLSWTLGGTTQAAETLTAPSSVLNIDTNGYSNLLTANQADGTDTLGNTTGFVGVKTTETLSSSTDQAHQGTKSLKVITPGSEDGEGALMSGGITTVSGVTYMASGWLYVPTGTNIIVWFGGNSQTVVGNDGWQFFNVSKTATGTNHSWSMITNTTKNITFYVDELQISATSTARTWIPGGTQVNSGTGTIELEAYLTNKMNVTAANFPTIGIGIPGNPNSINLIHRPTLGWYVSYYGQNGVYANIQQGATQSVGLYDLCVGFDNSEVNLFVNGVEKGTAITNPNPFSTASTLNIGGNASGITGMIIRNVTISRSKRSDTDITNRSNTPGFGKDRMVTLHAPLMHDLKAVRVRR